jgi:hypothetical protein
MTALRMAAIVEGHGDDRALPRLIARIAAIEVPHATVVVKPILRVPGNRLVKPGELERHVELAARRLGGLGAILVLLDCDWRNGCPKHDAPPLLARCRHARRDMLVSVVLAYKEFETWFLAAAESLAGTQRLAAPLTAPNDPEAIRGAKEWLSRHMPAHAPYTETLDQPALTSCFDMQAARANAASFDKCYREIQKLVCTLHAQLPCQGGVHG